MKILRLFAYILGGIFGSLLVVKFTVFIIVIAGVAIAPGNGPMFESVGYILSLVFLYLFIRGLTKGYKKKTIPANTP